MPLYEYTCSACGRRFERLVYNSSPATPACPTCHSRDVEKQYSSFGFGASSGGRRGGSPPVSFGGG